MNVALVLDYEVRKKLLMMKVDDKDASLESVKTRITNLIEKFIETDTGKALFEKNGKEAKMYNLYDWKNNIPEEIFKQTGIQLISAAESDLIYVVKAFDSIIKNKPLSAIFGVYDPDYCINKYQIDRLLNAVNWSNDYLFRPLIYDGACRGFGFVSEELLIDDEETDFSLEDFLHYAAKCAYTDYLDETKIYENQNFNFRLVRLDL